MADNKRFTKKLNVKTLGEDTEINFDTDKFNIDSPSEVNVITGDLNVDASGNVTYETNDFAINTVGKSGTFKVDGNIVVTGEVDLKDVTNRIYVSKNGNDSLDGRSWPKAKRTIKAALELAKQLVDEQEYEHYHTAIFIASGEYVEECPLEIPEGCAVIGDSLRSVTVKPQNPYSDVFYVGSNCYAYGMTIRGHRLFPSALDITPEGYAGANGRYLPRRTKQVGWAFSFTPGSRIRVSPYIQNCSSISGSGVFGSPDFVPGGGGVLVDPSVCAEGNRINSVVIDAFTQINVGGIGVKVVGRGYMQLVSFFVNMCQFGILCVDGGHVTLLNSNCSFGNYAFWAEGKRTLVREPDVDLDTEIPAVEFSSNSPYALARNLLIENKSVYQQSVVDWVDSQIAGNIPPYIGFNYNSELCYRDVGYIVDALVLDLLTKSKKYSQRAGDAYWVGNQNLIAGQEQQTILAIEKLRDLITNDLGADSSIPEIQSSITQITTTISSGSSGTDTELKENYPYISARAILNSRRRTYQLKVIEWINLQIQQDIPPFSGFVYNNGKCARDVGLIVDAIIEDLKTESLIYSRRAGSAYWDGVVNFVSGQEQQTVFAIDKLHELILADLTSGDPAILRIGSSINTVKDFIYNSPVKPFEDARILINKNRKLIENELILYVDSVYPTLEYDRLKCRRDINYIIDAIISDLVTGTGRACRTAGNAYWKGVIDIPFVDPEITIQGQESQTIAALDLIVELITNLIINQDIAITEGNTEVQYKDISLVTGGYAEQFVEWSIKEIQSIIQNGPDKDDLLFSPMFEDARTLLTKNKNFIAADTIAYVNTTYPTLDYDQDKCKRDVGYIIDAIVSDLATNSRESTLMAGNAYWRGVTAAISQAFINQVPETISAIDYAKRLCVKAIDNDSTPPIGKPELVNPTDMYIRSDGQRMFVLGGTGPKVFEFELSTPWDQTTLRYVRSFSVRSDEINPQGITFSTNGDFMFVIGVGEVSEVDDGRIVFKYSLSENWDISTSILVDSFDVSDHVRSPSGMTFDPTGLNLYIVGSSDARIYHYLLSSPWDIQTSSFVSDYSTVFEDNFPTAITYREFGDEKHLYITGSVNDIVVNYALNSAGELVENMFVQSTSIGELESELTGISISENGDRLYVVGLVRDRVISYDLLLPWDISSAEFKAESMVGFFRTPYQNLIPQEFTSVVYEIYDNALVCDSTFYLKEGMAIRFVPINTTLIFGGLDKTKIYYIVNIDADTFTISDTEGGEPIELEDYSLGELRLAVNPVVQSARYDIESNFNKIIAIIRDGPEELEEEFGSLIEATGYTLSYAGAGIDYSKLSKGQGGVGIADPNKYTIELDGGRVFMVATDESGDFYVGKINPTDAGETPNPLFRINQQSGAIDGRAFYQSIFGFVAPFVLALTRRK